MQHLDELYQLADFLEHFDQRKPGPEWFFHLHSWFAKTDPLDTDLLDQLRTAIPDLPYHGAYIGCAIGYLAHAVPTTQLRLSERSMPEPTYTTDDGHEYFGWRAVCEYFGITDDQSEQLFGSINNKQQAHSPAATAARIRAFLQFHQEQTV